MGNFLRGIAVNFGIGVSRDGARPYAGFETQGHHVNVFPDNGWRPETHGGHGYKETTFSSPSMPNSGMSDQTAKGYGYGQSGIDASKRAAEEDWRRVQKYSPWFEKASRETGIPKDVIAGVASRESRVGNALDRNGMGDHGNAYGLMQIDVRQHDVDTSGGPYSYENILQGARVLEFNRDIMKGKHPEWTEEEQLRGAIAAYNFGAKNVKTKEGIDLGTTGEDYSGDVKARAEHFKGKM